MNRQTIRGIGLASVVASLAVFVSCGGESSPAGPSTVSQAAKPDGGGSVSSKANTPPTVAARVTPTPVDGTVFGLIPLDVAINLCQSSDSDPGDSIRFDVTWGDGAVTGPGAPGAGTTVGEGGGPTGCDGKDCCRHRHRFESGGTYQVEARVSDKHLEDQSGGVSAKAITPYRFTVRAGTPEPSPTTGPASGTASFESSNVPVAIPDNTTVQSTVAASGVGTIQKVTASFHITHTFTADLDIFLIGPDGTTVELTSDNGGSGNDFGSSCADRTAFDDGAATLITSISSATAPNAGTFRPEGALSAFNGKSGAAANGTWTLQITDDAGADIGSLVCWAVTITSQ